VDDEDSGGEDPIVCRISSEMCSRHEWTPYLPRRMGNGFWNVPVTVGSIVAGVVSARTRHGSKLDDAPRELHTKATSRMPREGDTGDLSIRRGIQSSSAHGCVSYWQRVDVGSNGRCDIYLLYSNLVSSQHRCILHNLSTVRTEISFP
jgi:hypothetical protein